MLQFIEKDGAKWHKLTGIKGDSDSNGPRKKQTRIQTFGPVNPAHNTSQSPVDNNVERTLYKTMHIVWTALHVVDNSSPALLHLIDFVTMTM